MLKNSLFFFFFILQFNQCYSQNFKLGNVTLDELLEKKNPSDSSAVAVVLFSIGESSFGYAGNNGLEVITTITTKIKIYKKEGYDYANQSINFYSGEQNNVSVSVSNASTYNFENGKIVKTALGKNEVFTEKVNDYYSKKSISMPNVKEGSIIEFKFKITSPYENYIPEWEFQKNIPVKYSKFITIVPEFYIFTARLIGSRQPIIHSERKQKNIVLQSKARTGGVVTKTYFFTDDILFDEIITSYVMQDIPALVDEIYVDNIDNYRSSLKHELSAVNYPNAKQKSYSLDWESVAKTIYDDNRFGDELTKTGYFEDQLEPLLVTLSGNTEKANLIFNYVRSRMSWNSISSKYCDDGVRKAYKNSTGNSAEINLMLIAMLRFAGLEANPIILSTRSNGISTFPTLDSFNYVIAQVELNNESVLLDATNKFSIFNVLPIRDLNWLGRLIKKDGTSTAIDLSPNYKSKDVVNIIASITENGEVSGKIKELYYDYNAFMFRENRIEKNSEQAIEKLQKKYSEIEIFEYSLENSLDLSMPLIENYSFSSKNIVEIIDNKMFFSPLLFLATSENVFKQENRLYPIDFVYPNQIKFNISIKIPEGFEVDFLPKKASISAIEDLGNFKYIITSNGNQIQLSCTKEINQSTIDSGFYETIKKFYEEIVSKESEKIVLKKI